MIYIPIVIKNIQIVKTTVHLSPKVVTSETSYCVHSNFRAMIQAEVYNDDLWQLKCLLHS